MARTWPNRKQSKSERQFKYWLCLFAGYTPAFASRARDYHWSTLARHGIGVF